MYVGLWAAMGPGCVGAGPPAPVRDETTSGMGTITGERNTDEGDETEATPTCGNGAVDPGETCDGEPEASCEDLGVPAGTLACTDCRFDASTCNAPPDMVLVPAGPFTMGTGIATAEQPVRLVTLDAFWIDETEVTVAEYTTCVSSGACDLPDAASTNYGVAGRELHPINGVDWFNADLYCRWRARGGLTRRDRRTRAAAARG